jgi:hypothetical protein
MSFPATHLRPKSRQSSGCRSMTSSRGGTFCMTAQFRTTSTRNGLLGSEPHTSPAGAGVMNRCSSRRYAGGTGKSLLLGVEGRGHALVRDGPVCTLALAQVADRLVGHPAPVWLATVPHGVDRDLRGSWRRRRMFEPRPDTFAALRCPDPRTWAGVPAFARLLAELPDVRTGLSRLEHQITLGPPPLAGEVRCVEIQSRRVPSDAARRTLRQAQRPGHCAPGRVRGHGDLELLMGPRSSVPRRRVHIRTLVRPTDMSRAGGI